MDDSVCLAMARAQRCPADAAVLCRRVHRTIWLPCALFIRDTQYLCRVSVDDVLIGCISAILPVYCTSDRLSKKTYSPESFAIVPRPLVAGSAPAVSELSHSNDTIRSVCVAHSICVHNGFGASVSFGARHPEHLFKHNG